jgi:hypothetical protein
MSTLKLSVFGALFASLALSACLARGDLGGASTATPGSPPATATSGAPVMTPTAVVPTTTTVAPTATAVPPTSTAGVPTPTSQPPVTAEPTVLATPDPNQGVGDVIFSDPMDGSSGWHWTFADDAASFGLDGGVLTATMTTSQAWWRYSLGPDGLSAGDQQARVIARPVACAGDDEYGLIFRGADRDAGGYDLYVFKLRCSGAARFDALLGSETIPLVDWTASDAIQAGASAENALTVWMNAGEFRFFVNDQYLFSAHDDRLAAGYYGFYLYDRSAGGLTVNFDDLVTRQVTVDAAN